ncbi:MAG: ATP-dependent Clp protease ATP-binding subunit [Treponema sp.]|uniref:ATP-dependent Clp protease ATP-binding subunit n=1 Tax=Treponema rectale TaxID=744512 RepID=A0A7M1XKV0_9SPIR|nr:ATP-dependent Clp protease ATP-binding subunit [Treponema sp.]QOS40359.1 ATP-dependent Clp protease ATP-binding subunit [Treponema rectale]
MTVNNLSLSPRAQRLLVALAPDEAYKLGSTVLEPEHVILALLKSGDGLGYITLRTLRMNVLTLQLAIEQSMTAKIADIEVYDLPHSQRLKNVMELANAEASRSGLSYVGTEHFLLGAVSENPSLMNNYFKKAGITYEQLRNAVMDVEKKVPSSARIDGTFKPGIPGADGELLMSDGTSRRKPNANSILETFSRDLTLKAQEDEADPVIGRGNEIQRLIQILSRRQKNNPILVGEPGVGKTAVVEGLAARIVKGNVPKNLLDKRVLCLDLAAMIAGTKYRGEFEERMKRVMKEIRETRNVILFIDEIHTIIGAGGPEGSMDASNMMKPALSRGELQVIGATTSKEYRKYFEKDSALARRFQKIVVDEPDQVESIAILQGLKRKYEEFHNVIYDDDVIPAVVKYSSRYINERFLPDKAIDILDEAGAAKKIIDDERPSEAYELEKEIESLTEKKTVLVQQQDYEKAAMIRDKVGELRHRLDEVNREWKNSGKSAAKHVTVDDILSIISMTTGIDVEQLDDGESHRLVKMEEYIHQTVIGQDEAVRLICSAVRRNRAGVSSVKRPIGSFIFLGPTGVGKTQLAKTLAKFLFGTEDALIRIDMSDYMEKHNASRLVGAPPGYVGYDEGGTLTEKVRQHPYSVVLLDEIEKAHSDIFNLLLQMLEEGELSDNLGHTVSFKNTIVIMTSNAGARNIMAENRMGFSLSSSGVLPYDDIKSSAMEELKRIMTPELLNRVDDVVVFSPLEKEQINSILNIQLRELELRLGEQNLSLCIKPKAREYLIEHGYDPSMGARPLRRLIEREIEDELATLILSGKRGNSATVMVDYNGEKITVRFKKEKHENKTQQTLLVENV